ncbi:MAG: RbsD/FucU family protein [Paracoccaceae bacterium]
MLKGIDPRMPADLLDTLMRMGHGDELAVVDCNFPAHSTAARTASGRVIELPGFSAPEAIGMVTALMPLDGFAPHAALWMEVDGQGPEPGQVHREAIEVMERGATEGCEIGSIPRSAFYDRAARAHAVLRCTETRAYGCFILRKGVIL